MCSVTGKKKTRDTLVSLLYSTIITVNFFKMLMSNGIKKLGIQNNIQETAKS